MDAAVQVHDVPVVHADAASRHQAANRTRIVGAVDGEFAVHQHQSRGTHRILRRATLDIEVRRAATAKRYRRLPRWLDVFAGDPCGAEPLFAGAADADRVLERLILAGDEIEAAFLALDHDGARLGAARAGKVTRMRGAAAKTKRQKRRRSMAVLLLERDRCGRKIT
jgi:hypothetical protein